MEGTFLLNLIQTGFFSDGILTRNTYTTDVSELLVSVNCVLHDRNETWRIDGSEKLELVSLFT